MSNEDIWFIEYELAQADFIAGGKEDTDGYHRDLQRLGFVNHEIDQEIAYAREWL